MKPKLFLALILFFAIFINLLLTVREGACNYEDDVEYTGAAGSKENSLQKRGAPVKGSSPSPETCENTTLYENKENSKVASEKLNELRDIVRKTKESVSKNSKDISDNKKNNKALQNAVDPDGGDDSGGAEDPCEKYPEAC